MAQSLVETNSTSLGKIGAYSGFIAMYGVSGLTIGKDFSVGARYDNTSVNQNIVYGWQLPNSWLGGVRGYLEVMFGNYNWSDPVVPITPKKVSQITRLRSTISHQVVGDQVGINHEFYLTTTAHATGQLTDIVAEIAAFPHVTQVEIDYMNSVGQVGAFTDPLGRSWTVAKDPAGAFGPYTMFRPTNGVDVQGDIYWLEMLAWLILRAVITGQEYFNGMAIGPEPIKGASATKLSMTVDYA